MSMRHVVSGLSVPLAALLGIACASHEGVEKPPTKTVEPKPEPEPEPKPKPEPEPAPVMAQATVSSIYLQDDCPELDPAKRPAAKSKPAPAEPAQGSMAEPIMDEAQGDVADELSAQGSRLACSQSTMQLQFAGQGDEPGKVRIENVRLLSLDGKELGVLRSRVPTIWRDNGYETWNETVPANTDVKASYRLSAPKWGSLSSKGIPTEGGTFLVEVTLSINGQKQTVRSPEFTREMPHDIVT